MRILILAALVSLALMTMGGEPPRGEKTPADKQPVPVVVELFTSEGCSSCPPADAFLRELRAKPPREAEVILLGEHVDYWDYIGWTDRFASPLFSRRQAGYAGRFGLDSVYTPQMVVDGTTELVGSEEGRARRTIREAAKRPKPVTVKLTLADSDRLEVEIEPARGIADSAILLAITEDDLRTEVKRGENSGRELRHTAVVRVLDALDTFDGSKAARYSRTLELDPGWKRQEVRVAVIVQERESRRIVGASSLPLQTNPLTSRREQQ